MFIIVFPLDIWFWRALCVKHGRRERNSQCWGFGSEAGGRYATFRRNCLGSLEKVATSHGTSWEMLLLSALTLTSALIGKSTLQIFSTYGEKGNLFTVVIAPSGSGKTSVSHLECIDLIMEHVEPKIEKNIVMDDASSNGLFNHFVSGAQSLSSASTKHIHF